MFQPEGNKYKYLGKLVRFLSISAEKNALEYLGALEKVEELQR
jgi:hypothetical protein